MRVLPIVALFAVLANSATIYDALQASKQFTKIFNIVQQVPQLKNILSDPGVQVTFFAPSDNALTGTPYRKPFRYLFPGIVDVSKIKAGSRYNYRGEKIGFDFNNKHFGMRTEYVFLPGSDTKYQARILRAPLRKENGLLENGNLYYIDRCIYSCGELTRAQCEATADNQCRGKCNEAYERTAGSDVLNTYPDLSFDFAPPADLPPITDTTPSGAPGSQGSPPAPAPIVPSGVAVGVSDEYVNPDEDNGVNPDDIYEEPAKIGYGSPDVYGYGLGYYGR